MEALEIILRDENGKPTEKLIAEVCPSCGCKVWPSLSEHMRTTCPDIPKEIKIRCRRCKTVVKVVPGTREEMSKQSANLHVYLCGSCRARSTMHRRKSTNRPL